MIKPTLWEELMYFFAAGIACNVYETVCENNEDWELTSYQLRQKERAVIVEFNKSLTRFYVAKPWHRPCGFFGSLLLRSLVKRIRHSYLQRKLNQHK
jgi:hypothetical protein